MTSFKLLVDTPLRQLTLTLLTLLNLTLIFTTFAQTVRRPQTEINLQQTRCHVSDFLCI